MMDCMAKNMKAASEKPSNATPWPAIAPIAMPVAMTRYPAISMLRERCSVRAKRGSRIPPAAAAIHGMAVSRPICSGVSWPQLPMIPGRK